MPSPWTQPDQNTHLNSLPNDNIIDWSKLKAFADEKINMNEQDVFVNH